MTLLVTIISPTYGWRTTAARLSRTERVSGVFSSERRRCVLCDVTCHRSDRGYIGLPGSSAADGDEPQHHRRRGHLQGAVPLLLQHREWEWGEEAGEEGEGCLQGGREHRSHERLPGRLPGRRGVLGLPEIGRRQAVSCAHCSFILNYQLFGLSFNYNFTTIHIQILHGNGQCYLYTSR